MSRYLIACGGTGGHLAPGIALAEELVGRGHECCLLISNKQVDSRLIEKYDLFRFERLPGVGFSLNPYRAARFFWMQGRALVFALRLIREFNPDVIFGFGGYTSVAITISGYFRGVPVALHEANRVVGRAIRLVGRLARRVYLPVGVTLGNLGSDRVRYHGFPVRREIRRVAKSTARERLGLDPNQKLLLVLGGSQGASALNDWVNHHLEQLAQEGIQVYCVTGLGKGADGVFELRSRSGVTVRSVFAPFSDRMADLLSCADLAVTRAGAGTIAELIRCRLPAILIPYPYAADAHQLVNARFFEQQGGGLVLPEEYLGNLFPEIREVVFNDWLLRQFQINLERMDRENTIDRIVRDLDEIGREHEKTRRLNPATA
ncbi:MAG: UDP-N-acetylglucosamine--N-acetylmuramyl-(pentapeptide) pyrophosphoryl-undecaprenol N-acetylglucosamine transferase [Verrucomicrobia bacterium]|nr:MAG: UDP-N-acetylglucosamine--N-acetylmuramyl-(pentapeptide) pyrophosphoryl-undecaprenol N-acetylglucosamine transferase [Verrucomicrobiota bacterium]